MLTLLSGACISRSPIPTYYVLPSPDASPQLDISKREISGPIVTIDSVTIPSYLDQPQIFIQREQTSIVQFAEFHRWSEPLAEGSSRVLQQTISNILAPINGLAVGTNTTLRHDWTITIAILHFEGSPNNDVVLDAIWTLQSATHGISRTGHFTKKMVTGHTIMDMVITQGNLLEQLGIVIGNELRNHLPYAFYEKE